MDIVLSLAAAAAGGLLLQRLNVPGGLIIGAMLGAAIMTIAADFKPELPGLLQGASFIVVGAAIGVLVTRDALEAVRSSIVPALLAAVLIIAAGLGIAFLLRALGMAPINDVLATSPGGITAISAIAAHERNGAVEVSIFHLTRMVLVLLSVPALIHFLVRSSP